jgi:hypothetical protein
MEIYWLLQKRRFDVLLTVDQNLKYQQNLASFKIGVILMVARNNGLNALSPLAPEVREALERIKLGELIRIGGTGL